MNTETTEQKLSVSVQKTKADTKNQQSKSASKKEENPNLKTEDNKKAQETQETKSNEFNLGDNVSSEIHELLTMHNGLDLLITEKEDRLFFLQGMTKPIPREKRRMGLKSPLSAAKRSAARVEIKQLISDLVSLKEDRRSVYKRLTGRASNEASTLDDQKYREYAQSDYYLKRNSNRIFDNLVKAINEARTESMDDVVALVHDSKISGTKSRSKFQNSFLDFLRENQYQLYLLCTGKESFKKSVIDRFRKALKTWNPRRNELSL